VVYGAHTVKVCSYLSFPGSLRKYNYWLSPESTSSAPEGALLDVVLSHYTLVTATRDPSDRCMMERQLPLPLRNGGLERLQREAAGRQGCEPVEHPQQQQQQQQKEAGHQQRLNEARLSTQHVPVAKPQSVPPPATSQHEVNVAGATHVSSVPAATQERQEIGDARRHWRGASPMAEDPVDQAAIGVAVPESEPVNLAVQAFSAASPKDEDAMFEAIQALASVPGVSKQQMAGVCALLLRERHLGQKRKVFNFLKKYVNDPEMVVGTVEHLLAAGSL
jgi:hypothetical protein